MSAADGRPDPAGVSEKERREEILAMLRQRREHHRDLYFKLEDRAQFFAGIVLTVGAAFAVLLKGSVLGAGAWHGLPAWGWALVIGAAVLLLFSLAGVFLTLTPTLGRRLLPSWAGGLEGTLLGLVRWPRDDRDGGRERFLVKPPGVDGQPAEAKRSAEREHVAGFLLVMLRSSLGPAPSIPQVVERLANDPILEDEAHNLWAQWFVYMRRALLLRKTIVLSTLALVLMGWAYLAIPDKSADNPVSATPSSATAPPPGPRQPRPPNLNTAPSHH